MALNDYTILQNLRTFETAFKPWTGENSLSGFCGLDDFMKFFPVDFAIFSICSGHGAFLNPKSLENPLPKSSLNIPNFPKKWGFRVSLGVVDVVVAIWFSLCFDLRGFEDDTGALEHLGAVKVTGDSHTGWSLVSLVRWVA